MGKIIQASFSVRHLTPHTVKPATLPKAETMDQFAGSTIQDKTNDTAKNKCTASTKSCPVQILWSSDEKTMESNKENVKDASKTKTDNTQNKAQVLLPPPLRNMNQLDTAHFLPEEQKQNR